MVKCRDSSLYTGISTDPLRRLSQHNKGVASKYTRSRLPVELVYIEELSDKSTALKREIKIKALKKDKKLSLLKSPTNILNKITSRKKGS